MYCKICGAPSETEVCPNCAAQQQYQQPQYQQPYQDQYQQPYQQQYQDPYQQQYQAPQQPQYQEPYQQPQYQAPQQPQYQAPQQPAPAPAGDALKANWNMIIAIVAAVGLLLGLLTCFGVFEIGASTEMNGRDMGSGSGNVYDVPGEMGGTWLTIGTILFSLTSIVAGAIGVLYFLKVTQNKPYYDQYIGSKLGKLSPALVMGALVVVGAVLQFVLFLLAGGSEKSMGVEVSYSYSVSWVTWVMLILFGGLAALDKFVVNKEQ